MWLPFSHSAPAPEAARRGGYDARVTARLRIALFVLCAAAYVLVSPGRISFPDDEIVFQTTRSLWERGDLVVEGIPKRTGELKGRPDGTFGWAPGVDGRRYGFFGHALSVVALPMYGLGELAAERAPEEWRHAIRSDHFWVHRRDRAADFTRMLVGFTNCLVTALAALLVAEWIRRLGYGVRTAVITALAYAFATSAFPYTRTFLSEPLSTVCLLVAAIGVTEFHRVRDERPIAAARWLWGAAALLAISLHTHVLNVVEIPIFAAWVLVPLHRSRALSRHRSAWLGAIAIGLLGAALLGLGQWLRFGDPWETGRYDHYSWFQAPGEGLVAMLLAPGRSILVYSPALLVALPGWRAFGRRHRDVAIACVAIFVARWLFVGLRSDWWGGWAIGPRYLLPVVPFLLLPLAELVERPRGRRAAIAVAVALVASALLCLHLSLHSIFEHMLVVSAAGSDAEPYLHASHWWPSRSPIVGFFHLRPDVLSVGALDLRRHGYPGLARVFAAVAAAGLLAGAALFAALARRAESRASAPDCSPDASPD